MSITGVYYKKVGHTVFLRARESSSFREFGYWKKNRFGGKAEPGELFVEVIEREMNEDSGLDVDHENLEKAVFEILNFTFSLFLFMWI